jgi:glycine hydroxymethyltransferase
VNKNSVLGDVSAVTPGGVRFGTPAMTTRGMKEIDMKEIAKYIDQITKVAQRVQSNLSSKKLDDFISYMDTNLDIQNEISNIKNDVERYASKFYIPGSMP